MIYDAIVLVDSPLLLQYTTESLIKFIKPIQYWVVASQYSKNIGAIDWCCRHSNAAQGFKLMPAAFERARETFATSFGKMQLLGKRIFSKVWPISKQSFETESF